MTGLLRLVRFVIAAGCLVPMCFSQALVEHAAAAAVGTAGSAGGKVLSNTIDRVFKQTDTALQGTETKKGAKKETKQPAATPEQRKKAAAAAAAASAIPTTTRASSRRLPRPTIAGTVVSITQQSFEPPSAATSQPATPAPPVVTADDFARISPGATRQDLLTHIGQPAYRVRISGDGHVQEFYRYASGGVDLGSIRVTDGTVTAVRAKGN